MSRLGLAAAFAWLAGSLAPAAAQPAHGGVAFVTKFSGTTTVGTIAGPQTVIDPSGQVGVALDLSAPGYAADGRHWLNEPHLFSVTAGEVGQVFGVTVDDASPPNVYVTATSAFGLHRAGDNSAWMTGMWGRDGGPGTVYRLVGADNYRAEKFAEITLAGRSNTGAALGNIAYDKWHRQLFVTDLETGMIHRVGAVDGADLGYFDHGMIGRGVFTDAATGRAVALPPVPFDPASSARIANCPVNEFSRAPACWNFADFRRRVWGLDVRRDAGTGEIRLYYAIWGSQGFGNPAWTNAGDDQKNSVWSIALAADGGFDALTVRREFLIPEFYSSIDFTAHAGPSHPVATIAFAKEGAQATMLLAERGGVRNLGLAAENAFAYPHEARVLRYELDASGRWQPAGRYDVGFHDREVEGPPYLRAGAAGGVAFGPGYGPGGQVDLTQADAFAWMTGDALCSPSGACFDPVTGSHSDTAEVSGLQGQTQTAYQEIAPAAANGPYRALSPADTANGLDRAYLVDADVNVDPTGNPIAPEVIRNDATRVGAVALFQQPPAVEKRIDLRLAKRPLAPSCAPGIECRFEVTVSNAGNDTYRGPLTVLDRPGDGAAYVGLPPADWTCSPQGPGAYQCVHGPVDLPPGASISFPIGFAIPAWWSQPVFTNCVDLLAPGPEAYSRAYANNVCAYVATASPGTPAYLPDLRFDKFAVGGQCDWFGVCRYLARVTNVGAAPYAGPLAIRDQVDYAGAVLAGWGPSPEWVCGPGGGNAFACTHGPVVLAPGEFREVTLAVAAGPIVPGIFNVRNCGWIDWGGGPRDLNPANEYGCAVLSRFPSGHPMARPILDIRKKAGITCESSPAGWGCFFLIDIINIGSAPYFGPISINEAPDSPAARLGGVAPAFWTCVPGTGFAGAQACSRPGVPGGLQPGDSVTMMQVYDLLNPVPVPSALRNCATIASDFDGDGFAENHTDCAIGLICNAGSDCPKDLAIHKRLESLDPCFPGFPCRFGIIVENLGDAPYPAPVTLTDLPNTPIGPPTVAAAPDFSCLPAGPAFACSWPHDIPAGGQAYFSVEFTIPPDHPGPLVTNCAAVPPGPNNTLPFNDQDCVDAFVPFPDLAPSGGTVCERGADCTLFVGIDNRGLLPFLGSAGMRGTLVPPVEIKSVSTRTAGLACAVTGNGSYECNSGRLAIPPGAAARLEIVIAIPADFAGDAISHSKEMLWPDFRVRDKRPENDRSTSIITITGPPPLACRGGAVRGNECVCPPGTRRDQIGANAFVCAATPPPPQPILCVNGTTIGNECVCPPGAQRQTTGANAFVCVPPPPPPPPPLFCANGTVVGNQCVCPPGAIAEQTGFNAFACLAPPPPPIFCTGGTVRDGRCICPQGMLTEQIGTNAYRCVAPPRVVCTGGTVRNNECFCPQGMRPEQVAPSSYRCVAIPPQIVCTGGTVFNNECLCPDGLRAERTGPNAFRCVPIPPQVVCTGGTVRNNQCVCPQGMRPEQVGPNSFRCVPIPPPITCTGGTVRNNECICPQGMRPDQVGTNAFRCVPIPPQIICTGGTVRDGKCVCPEGMRTDQVGTNAFRCVPIPPQIICTGGTMRDGKCVCPEGMRTDQVGANAFRCVPIPPPITCTGGTVRNNECVCPQGMRPDQVGTNAFRCVPIPPPITCTGGTVRDNQCVCPQGMRPDQVGTNAFRCVAIPPQITCTGGSVRDGRCICPEGMRTDQVGTNAFRCVPIPPQITCIGGTVRNNQCVCPQGMSVERLSDTAFRCVAPPPPQITCTGGTVRNGQCICPQGSTLDRIGNNVFRCVAPPPPQITCSGGTVRDGRCVCPEGMRTDQVGTNAFRCVAPPPQIVCTGGTVRNNQCVCPQGMTADRVGNNAFRCVAPEAGDRNRRTPN
ncbi:MAG: hypothetical protein U1E56_03090 [Bauldia sp.]